MKSQGIAATFFKYVSLNVIAMIGLSCYILADTFFVSNGVGIDGLTALNLAIPIYSVISGTGLMLGVGGATKYSIFKAQNNEREANRVFSHAVILGVVLGLLFLLAGIFLSGHLSRLLGSDEITLPLTNTYLKTIMCFAPMFILNNILVAFVRNDGAPNLSMTAMLAGSISNIILDYVFVYPLRLGMFGAAFATGIAPVISMVVMTGYFLKKKNGFHFIKGKIKTAYFKTITSLGIASMITEVSSGVVIILFNIVILGLEGNTGVAAYGIIANLALVAVSIFTGIAQGIQPIISTCYGKGETANIKKVRTMAMVVSLACAVLIYGVVFIFRQPLVSVFNSAGSAKLADLAEAGLAVYFTGFFFAGLNIILASLLGAVEKPVQSFLISIFRGCVFIIPLIFLLSAVMGMQGVWLTYLVAEMLTFITVYFFVFGKNSQKVPKRPGRF